MTQATPGVWLAAGDSKGSSIVVGLRVGNAKKKHQLAKTAEEANFPDMGNKCKAVLRVAVRDGMLARLLHVWCGAVDRISSNAANPAHKMVAHEKNRYRELQAGLSSTRHRLDNRGEAEGGKMRRARSRPASRPLAVARVMLGGRTVEDKRCDVCDA